MNFAGRFVSPKEITWKRNYHKPSSVRSAPALCRQSAFTATAAISTRSPARTARKRLPHVARRAKNPKPIRLLGVGGKRRLRELRVSGARSPCTGKLSTEGKRKKSGLRLTQNSIGSTTLGGIENNNTCEGSPKLSQLSRWMRWKHKRRSLEY